MPKKDKYGQLKEILFLLTITVAIFSFVVVGATQLYYLFSPKPQVSSPKSDRTSKKTTPVSYQNILKEKVNILILGVDQRKGDIGRSDTLILVSVDPQTKSINAVSIPRDSRVEIPGHGVNKINSAYAWGGVDLTKETVENFLQVPIHYYFQLNYQALVQAIDGLGGINVSVEKAMHYTDSQDGLYIDLEPGYQHLDGRQAMGYVRYRHDALGDIGRIERQQNFIQAVTQQILKPTNLVKLPFILRQISQDISTDIPTPLLLALGHLGYQAKDNGLKMETLPGEGQYLAGASYWIVDNYKMQKVLEPLL